MRYSAQRQQVYDVLASTNIHPDAQWVYNKVRAIMPDISLGTVYRNLSQLVSSGMVKRISAIDNVERFDACTDRHAHFVCNSCGCISDVVLPEVNGSELEHQIDNVEVMYYGTCKMCLAQQNK